MRGKEAAELEAQKHHRITPAYAGKSNGRPKRQRRRWDHPRVCGEKSRPVRASRPSSGITPAYAGKRDKSLSTRSRQRDHPRVCGEKAGHCTRRVFPVGSPPRMRGKASVALLSGQIVGITPAYAGKRADGAAGGPGLGDHPRVCGEKSASSGTLRLTLGSPPRMRGKASCKTLML